MSSTCLDCYEVELRSDPAPRFRIVVIDRSLLAVPQPAVPDERVIRYARENAERCACRLLALAAVKREIWRAELAEVEG
jgi:hypothetical protein